MKRLCTQQSQGGVIGDVERSEIALENEEAPAHLAAEYVLHALAGWSTSMVGGTLFAAKGNTFRRVWLEKAEPVLEHREAYSMFGTIVEGLRERLSAGYVLGVAERAEAPAEAHTEAAYFDPSKGSWETL